MRKLSHLFESNRTWAEGIRAQDPEFFDKLADQQSPSCLWIGCSDSRVPATQLVGLMPGEMFVHRNIANVVVQTDFNCLSVMQYAVDALKVEHIIVCGHYGCGGVGAALHDQRIGLIDNWLCHIRDVKQRHRKLVDAAGPAAHDRLCELNVIEQVMNVCQTTIVRDAWAAGQELAVHGWIYGLKEGLLRDLDITVLAEAEIADVYERAVAAIE
ncbi:Carbonic anhydrase 2 [Pseudobythopirellula maris]|uniref:Carbonic anhydrase n=1 Tax=Pseudobythopirellula maris TaxID=2527991 RepID=A0A5C5ZM37_9BACT|nr:carbonate dehydratase [Pseudobythopirellula maris]TWT88146.1 Carbonic anhydrase 2 [Pseudobythopirellula maris]